MRNETITVGDLYSRVNDGKIKSDIDVQREIVYNDEKQRLVIDSLVHGIPLPAFYFWEPSDGILETLDGKQRIHAITRFKQNDLEYEGRIWLETDSEIQDKINAVELTCIICDGTDDLKREIFRRINTLGVPLSSFEVLNGLFAGEYLRGLTTYCKSDKGAIKVLGDVARGKRQMKALRYLLMLDHLKPTDLNEYVAKRRDISFAEDQRRLDKYIDFVADIFEDMSLADVFFQLAVRYYNDKSLWKANKKEINKQIKAFKKSDDWKLIPGKDKPQYIEDIIKGVVNNLSLDPRRLFSPEQRQEMLDALEEVDGKYPCAICGHMFFADELFADHIIAWSKGGRTELSNGQMLCRACNTAKSNA